MVVFLCGKFAPQNVLSLPGGLHPPIALVYLRLSRLPCWICNPLKYSNLQIIKSSNHRIPLLRAESPASTIGLGNASNRYGHASPCPERAKAKGIMSSLKKEDNLNNSGQHSNSNKKVVFIVLVVFEINGL